jgi:cell division protein YceG involved in septum cleavage
MMETHTEDEDNMNKLHGKSVLLGMGIGTILTALLGLIFFLGYQPEMDEAKVKALARKYGMVEPGELGSITIEIPKDITLTALTEKLADAGLIRQENMVSFQIKLASRKVQEKMKPGIYEFSGKESEDQIIDILISQ